MIHLLLSFLCHRHQPVASTHAPQQCRLSTCLILGRCGQLHIQALAKTFPNHRHTPFIVSRLPFVRYETWGAGACSRSYQIYCLFSCITSWSRNFSLSKSLSITILCKDVGTWTTYVLMSMDSVVDGTPDSDAHFLASMTKLVRDERSGTLRVVRLMHLSVLVSVSSKLTCMAFPLVNRYDWAVWAGACETVTLVKLVCQVATLCTFLTCYGTMTAVGFAPIEDDDCAVATCLNETVWCSNGLLKKLYPIHGVPFLLVVGLSYRTKVAESPKTHLFRMSLNYSTFTYCCQAVTS